MHFKQNKITATLGLRSRQRQATKFSYAENLPEIIWFSQRVSCTVKFFSAVKTLIFCFFCCVTFRYSIHYALSHTWHHLILQTKVDSMYTYRNVVVFGRGLPFYYEGGLVLRVVVFGRGLPFYYEGGLVLRALYYQHMI